MNNCPSIYRRKKQLRAYYKNTYVMCTKFTQKKQLMCTRMLTVLPRSSHPSPRCMEEPAPSYTWCLEEPAPSYTQVYGGASAILRLVQGGGGAFLQLVYGEAGTFLCLVYGGALLRPTYECAAQPNAWGQQSTALSGRRVGSHWQDC